MDRGAEEFGCLHGIVANAGICIPGVWDEIRSAEFKDTIDNVTGLEHCDGRRVAPGGRRR